MREHSFDQGLSKFAHIRFGGTHRPKIVDSLGSFVKIAPKMILNGRLPRFASFSHDRNYERRNSEIVSVIATAARAASVPRLILSPKQRSRACASLFRLRTALMIGTPVSIAMRCNASVTERARLAA